MKELLKKAIYGVRVKPYEDIIAEIDSKAVVSFDVFNTLVRRDVMQPEDVFGLLEKKIPEGSYHGSFKAARMQAEASARKEHPERDIRLEEIYAHFPAADAVKSSLMEMECREEIAVSAPNLILKRVYDHCVEKKKRILFISDMYLPTDTVGKILKKNGYSQGKLYVSSASGKMKRNGKLFRFVQEQESLDISEWIHMGDSIISDYLQPQRLGIKALLIEQDPTHFEYTDKRLIKRDQSYRQLITFINNRLPSYTDPYERIGYGVLGPLLYGFSRWLEEKVPADRQLVFLAREGALLQRAFATVSDRPSVYMYVSRHAAYEAFLDRAEDTEQVLQGKIRVLKVICSREEFARSCGLSDEEIETVFRENHFQKDGLCTRIEDKKAVLDAIWPLVKQKAAGQYRLMEQYIRELGITGDCSAADVGWRATIQVLLDSLNFVLDGAAITWDGYYMGCREYGTNDADSHYRQIKKQGYLFDPVHNKQNKDTVLNSVSFFELLFLSTEGTTKRYALDEQGHVVPVKGQADNPPEINDMIKRIQDAGIRFLQDIQERPFPVSTEAAFADYKKIANVPTLKTLALFKDFAAYDEHSYSLANDHSLGYYIVHPRQFMKEFAKKPALCSISYLIKSLF